jgi:hypothetical protein
MSLLFAPFLSSRFLDVAGELAIAKPRRHMVAD